MEEQIIVKLTIDHPEFMDRVLRLQWLINHHFTEKLSNDLFVETIQDGLLYIFRNMDVLQKIHTPLSKKIRFLARFFLKIPSKEEEMIFGDILCNKETYPPRGILYILHTKHAEAAHIYSIIGQFYQSINPSILVKIEEEKISLHFSNIHAMKTNCGLMYQLIKHSVPKNKLDLHKLYEDFQEDLYRLRKHSYSELNQQ